MFRSLTSSRSQESSSGLTEAKDGEDVAAEKGRKKKFTLKIYTFFKKNHKQENLPGSGASGDSLDCGEEQQQEDEELLENIGSRLIVQEEQLFSQDAPSEQEQDELHKDLQALIGQVWTVINNTFTSSTREQREALKSAAAVIQQQEEQDRRWAGWAGRVDGPVWRPQKCASTHNTLLQGIVESRLRDAVEEDSGESTWSPVKKEVLLLGKRVKEDLLAVVRTVRDCYPPQMDVLNVYAGLYHQRFSARLTELAASGLETDDCCYVLLWVNHCYPREILKHKELEGEIKVACLGSLLLPETLDQLEEQHLAVKQDKVKLWLDAVLAREEASWLNGDTPELLDSFYSSPLAVDVIQMIDGSLSELSRVIRDQSKAQGITLHLQNFLSSYKESVQRFVEGNHRNMLPVVKAHLACEEQLRDYVTGHSGSLSEERRHHCLHSLSALRDCGYRCFTGPIRAHLKVCGTKLWTPAWLGGSLPVVDSLLDSLSQQLTELADLKPVCKQSLLHVIYESVVLQYVKKMMKAGMKGQEDVAQRIVEDAQKINDFFSERGCRESSWLSALLASIAEILRLRDPGSVQLETVFLAQRFPDLSDAHVLALLSLKTGLSSSDIRGIRRSVEENRGAQGSANHGPPFFSKVKVKWIDTTVHRMRVVMRARLHADVSVSASQ